ncbi:MAG: hypothetical protein HY906_06650 [Deltaproteobacteria bacterium]|nr:hypothetical protein [Deltaproteobacteria bacterium]
MRRFGVVVGAALLVALAAGCTFDVNGVPTGRTCTTDDECGPDEVCYRTYCVLRECQAPAECGRGQQFTCPDGLCHAVTCAEGCGAGYGCYPGPGGYCTAVACTTNAECDDGKPCNGEEWCEYGQCVPGTPVSCDPSPDPCVSVVCDDWAPGDPCVAAPVADGTSCDDGDACTSGETCHDGGCGLPTTTVACTALDQCHVAGTCAPATGECTNPAAPDGTSCDDGRTCTGGESCQDGVCTPAASTCACDRDADCVPLDQCHRAGTCDVATGVCSNPAKPDGTSCDDGSACTTGETCQAGGCGQPTTTVTCTALDQCHVAGTCHPATGGCSNPPATNGTTCDDGRACTTGDTCQAGVCTPALSNCPCSTDADCFPLDQCHLAGTCNVSAGLCSNPLKPDDTPCNDASACTTGETCQAGVCGSPTSTVTCTALDQCHVAGTCDPGTGVCSNPPENNGASCTDGNACTQTDTCQGGLCTGGKPVTCTALDQCHVAGTCDPGTGLCSNPPKGNGTSCNDGNACTFGETCQAGVCGAPTSVVTCTALDQCHDVGTCDPANGQCSNPPKNNGTACNDGSACTFGETCQGGVCGAPTSVVTCTALDNCHLVGICDPATGLCSNPPKDCADAFSCTDDSCDFNTGNCLHLANDGRCTPPQLCRPSCFGGPSGCGAPPTSLTASCSMPPQWSERNGADPCTITLSGGTTANQAACLKCDPFRGVTEAFFTDFDDGSGAPPPPCSLDGWNWDASSICTDTSTWCPIQAAGALHDARAFQADRGACPSNGQTWVINRAVNATGLAGVNVCFNAASHTASNGSSLALAYGTAGTGGPYAPLFRDFGGPFSNPPFGAVTNMAWQRYCVVLPPNADANPNVALRFTLFSTAVGEAIYLDSIGVFAYEPACTAWSNLITSTITCPGPQPGWSMSGGVCGTFLGNDYLLAENGTLTLTSSPALNTAAVDGDLILRFDLISNGTTANDWVLVELSTASGPPSWQTVFPQNGGWGGGWAFTTFSANLSQVDPTANHNPNLLLRFTMRSAATGHYLILDNIRLDAVAFTCQTSAVTVTVPTGTGPTYDFTAASTVVQPAQLVCSWDAPATPIDDRASIDFAP